jgi:hypothetical protein
MHNICFLFCEKISLAEKVRGIVKSMEELPRNENGIAGAPMDPQIKSSGNVETTLEAANEAPRVAPKEDIQDSIDRLHNDDAIPHLRTYESDIADALKKKNTSVASIAAAEQEKHPPKIKREMTPALKNVLMLSISLAFIGVSILIFGLFFFNLQGKKSVAIPAIEKSKILATEATQQIPLHAADNTLQLFITGRDAMSGNNHSLVGIEFSTTTTKNNKTIVSKIGAQEFFTRMQTQAPSWLIRSFAPEYLAAYFNTNGDWQPVWIVRVDSYENAFSGMLKWEETMATDLAPLYSLASSESQMDQGPTNQAALENSTSQPGEFADLIINNKSTRVLIGNLGEPVLYYAFPDKNTLIITPSLDAFKEILARLTTSQFVQ